MQSSKGCVRLRDALKCIRMHLGGYYYSRAETGFAMHATLSLRLSLLCHFLDFLNFLSLLNCHCLSHMEVSVTCLFQCWWSAVLQLRYKERSILVPWHCAQRLREHHFSRCACENACQ